MQQSDVKPANAKKVLKYSSPKHFLLRQRRVNPSFCRDEMQDKADPEGDAEKIHGASGMKSGW